MRGRARWRDLVVMGTVMILVGGCTWTAWTIAGLARDRSRLEGQVSTLAEQVRHLGGTPQVTPTPGPSGSQGAAGQPGAPGAPGVTGKPGTAGSRGPQGDPGKPGPSGAAGTPGTSIQGPAGPQGPPGKDGTDGKDGKPGEQGPPGPACPDGYQSTTLTVVTAGGPRDIATCTRDSP